MHISQFEIAKMDTGKTFDPVHVIILFKLGHSNREGTVNLGAHPPSKVTQTEAEKTEQQQQQMPELLKDMENWKI